MVQERAKVIQVPDALPLLPLRDTVLFPMVIAPILIGQERSLKLVTDVVAGNHLAALVTQKNPERRPSTTADLYPVGTMAVIHELTRLDNDTVRIAVQGIERIRVLDVLRTEPYLIANVAWQPDVREHTLELEALTRTARSLFVELVAMVAELSDDLASAVGGLGDAQQLAYLIASSIPLSTAARQEILESDTPSEKLRQLIEVLQHELAVRQLMQKMSARTNAEMSKDILRRQMESIQRELGDVEPELAESRELRERIGATHLSPEARKEAEHEVDRLERTPLASPEHSMIRTFLDWLLKLPWGTMTGEPIDLGRARAVLDEDHYDLEKIKDRILEYLAVKRLRDTRALESTVGASDPAAPHSPKASGDPTRSEPILCFLGPPGVGKTSLGRSIARAMGRRFARVSLGGIHDEAEIRGHRRTYVGAMPGRILQAIAASEAADPVFVLDEVDKLGVGFHGDPSAALLEVLDPAQNHAFVDTYLGLAFDLSSVLFICTANTLETIPAALRDRMETIALAGYTDAEKLHIALRHLVPKQLEANALRPGEVTLGDGALLRIVREYTREAGVRNLEREIASILRKAARRIGEGALAPIRVNAASVPDSLGPQRFYDEVLERIDRPGVATGLAWTPSGGEVLFVEATMMPSDEERLVLTGMLGDVMRESAQAALSYLRANAERLGVEARVFQRRIVHVHVPSGAIPKDGPSAGVTMAVAIASAVTGRLVRNDLAATGEITLRGKVLPVGGIKEKVLAAHRAGIKTIVLPRRNESAIDEVPDEARRDVEFVLVESVDDVLGVALEPLRRAIPEEPAPIH